MSDKSVGQKSKKNNQTEAIKVGYVLAYRDTDYVRTSVLLRAIELSPRLQLVTAINHTSGLFRYVDTLLRLIKLRFTVAPDVYIFGFRSHESFWLFRFVTLGRPVIFDEFINMQNSLTNEKKIIKPNGIAARIARLYVRSLHYGSTRILTDTALHALSSSNEYGTKIDKFRALYVGCDEQLFFPKKTPNNDRLQVFFYGNIEALHGLEYILQAAEILNSDDYEFTIIGGRGKPAIRESIEAVRKNAPQAVINHVEWLPLKKLPEEIAKADVCLGGPFGDTPQARVVITGKTFQFMAMGKATIIGAIDQEDGFVDRKNCLLVRQGSAKAIVDQLEWAATHRKQLNIIGSEANKLFQYRFSSHAISEELESIIKEVVTK